jgi:hypothetical protein
VHFYDIITAENVGAGTLKGVVGVNKARVKENCFCVIESWEKTIMKKI